MNNEAFCRFCLLVLAISFPVACTAKHIDRREISYHESGHALYGIATNYYPTSLHVTVDGDDVSCPGAKDPPPNALGVACFSGPYGAGHMYLWNNCSLHVAGRYGVLVGLGYDEEIGHHKYDDERVYESAAAILEAKNAGGPWLPTWPGGELDEKSEPTEGEIVAECHRRAKTVVEENRDSLVLLGEALHADADGMMSAEDIHELLDDE